MRGLVADDVAAAGDAGAALLRGVHLSAPDHLEVEALRVTARDRAGGADHRVRGGDDSEDADRPELIAPHPRPETVGLRAADLHRVIRVARRLRPEVQTLRWRNDSRVDQQRHGDAADFPGCNA